MASSEHFYPGADYGLDPGYGLVGGYGNFTGYRMSASNIGITSDPRNANQLGAVSRRLFTGAKTVEVNSVNIMGGGPMKLLDSIPKQQFKEIERLKKLTGVDLTFHGPLVEPTGVSKQGWDDTHRQNAEREIFSAVERGHDLDPKGNIVITFHSSNGLPAPETKVVNDKTGKSETTEMWFVNERTGTFESKNAVQKDYLKKDPKVSILEKAEEDGKEAWFRDLQHVNFNSHAGQADMIRALSSEGGVETKKETENVLGFYRNYIKDPEKAEADLKIIQQKNPEEAQVLKNKMLQLTHSDIYFRESYQGLKNLFNQAYESAERTKNERDLKLLEKFKEGVAPKLKNLEEDPSKIKEFNEMLVRGVNVLRQVNPPQRLTPLRDFAIDKASDTFGNAAFSSYKKFGNTSPIISIENPPVGMGLTSGEDLRDLAKAAREKFANRAVKELGMSDSEARKHAEKLIGVTWDVGHINMMRGHGFGEKDIIAEAKKVAPYVKHVHLSDNFGLEHTELPMGMGNVPVKKHLELIEQYNKQAKKIIEAAEWQTQAGLAQPFSPVRETLTAFGSSLYDGGAPVMPPYWNQVAASSGYFFAGIGPTNPDIHHQTFGAGFSNLPVDLGGQMAGRSRASGGTPFE